MSGEMINFLKSSLPPHVPFLSKYFTKTFAIISSSSNGKKVNTLPFYYTLYFPFSLIII